MSQHDVSRLNVTATAAAAGLLWGGALLACGLAAMATRDATGDHYGRAFLEVMASVYPGYHGTARLGDTVVGTLYGLVDGAIAGGLFAWLYGLVARRLRGGSEG